MCMTPKYTKACYITASTTRDDRLGIYNRCNHLARLEAYTSTCHASQSSEHVRVYFIITLVLIVDTPRCVESLKSPLTAVVSCPCDGRI
jgi:hypothetical protein